MKADNELCACMQGQHHIFNYINADQLDELSKFFKCRSVPAGEDLWKEGDPCDYAAFIVSGRVEVKKQTEFKGRHVIVGIYSRGAVVGALCILDGTLRSITATAMEDVTIAAISREDFETLINTKPELGSKLMKGMLLSLSIRLRKSFERLASFF